MCWCGAVICGVESEVCFMFYILLVTVMVVYCSKYEFLKTKSIWFLFWFQYTKKYFFLLFKCLPYPAICIIFIVVYVPLFSMCCAQVDVINCILLHVYVPWIAFERMSALIYVVWESMHLSLYAPLLSYLLLLCCFNYASSLWCWQFYALCLYCL
jgi:hypothetical protein